MGHETNIESIRALEKQIEDHRDERTIICLKRVRNSLLNISALPPETLGYIFHWNVIPEPTFEAELTKGSYNFLLVCHHWFEVASRTPELWGFWGNNLEDWKKRCLRSQAAPLNLVLGSKTGTLDGAVRNALRDHATQDTIRHVRLRSGEPELLSTILSTLITDRERPRTISLESFVLCTEDRIPTDVSDFFAHQHLPKLRHLALTGCTISSWDYIMSRTTLLTTLVLEKTSPSPTTSQLLSILASNPHLEELTLSRHMIPSDGGSESSLQVKLHRLKRLDLAGRPPHLFEFIHHLEYPKRMDDLSIVVCDCSASDIRRTVGPYLQAHLRCHGKSEGGLELFLMHRLVHDTSIILHVGEVSTKTHPPISVPPFASFIMILSEELDEEGLERLELDLITHVPLEEVVSIRSVMYPIIMTDLCPRLPNLAELFLVGVNMSTVFPTPDQGESRTYEAISPSLRHIYSIRNNHGWSALIGFLSYRASVGNPILSLLVAGSHLSREEVESIRRMVGEVRIDEVVPGFLGRC